MATYYFRNTGANWGATGDWSSTPSPSYTAVAQPPTTADDVIFEAASANCIINTGPARNCLTLTCTAYTRTLTFNASLTVISNVALGSSSMGMTGASALALTPTATTLSLSSGGCICAVPLTITRTGGTATLTFGSNWTQTGTFTVTGTTAWTFNGFTLTLSGTSVAWNNGSTLQGTTTILFAPDVGTTMNFTSTGNIRWQNSAITINGAGSLNINIANFTISTTFTYTAGTVTHTGILIFAATNNMNTSGMSFQNGQTFNTSNTTNLTSNLTFTGSFTIPSSIPTINGPGQLLVAGSFTNNNAGGAPGGTAAIILNGTGTVSGTSTGGLANPITINTTGTITFSGTIAWLRTLTFTTGTIVSTGSTITSASNANFTINGAGFNLNAFNSTSNTTFTVNGAGFNLNSFTTTGSTNFLGTEGITFSTFTATSTAAITLTFQSTDTYNITSGLSLLGVAATPMVFRSSSAGSQAIVNLSYGASLDVGHVSATDINSRGGQTIWNYKGTNSNATNWNQLPTIPKTIGQPFVR